MKLIKESNSNSLTHENNISSLQNKLYSIVEQSYEQNSIVSSIDRVDRMRDFRKTESSGLRSSTELVNSEEVKIKA